MYVIIGSGCAQVTHEKSRKHALAHAAFTSYPALSKFRDFKMELEEGSTEANPRVGLWAKVYMTSPTYEYLGAIMTLESYKAVTHTKRRHQCNLVRCLRARLPGKPRWQGTCDQ